VTPVPGDPNPSEVLPVAIAEVAGAGLPRAVDPATVDGRCHPLLTVDGAEVQVRAVGATSDARAGLALEPCDGPLALGAGTHTIASGRGVDTGWDVDRLVLSSDADGGPDGPAARGAPRSEAGTTVEVERDHRGTDYDLALTTDGEPFWLVLGQSDDRGWSLDVEGASVGPRQIVDGYANGWLVTPDGPGELGASMAWQPQRLVWVTLVLSALAVVACLVLLIRTRRQPRDRSAQAPQPTLADPAGGRRALTPGAPGLAVAAGIGALLVATPAAAVTASVAVVIGLAVPRATWAWALAAPMLVLVARGLERPRLAWLALALLASDLIVEWWTARSVRGRAPADRRRAPAR